MRQTEDVISMTTVWATVSNSPEGASCDRGEMDQGGGVVIVKLSSSQLTWLDIIFKFQIKFIIHHNLILASCQHCLGMKEGATAVQVLRPNKGKRVKWQGQVVTEHPRVTEGGALSSSSEQEWRGTTRTYNPSLDILRNLGRVWGFRIHAGWG